MALFSSFAKISSGIRFYSGCIGLNDTYIISAVRTPIGCFQGKLSSFSAVQLGHMAVVAAVERSKIPKEEIQELVLGCSIQAGLGQGPARQVALFAGFPPSIITSSVNKLCASGMKAAIVGCQILMSNTQEVVAVVGAESLTNAPLILRRKNLRVGNIHISDLILHDTLVDIFEQVDVTSFAEESAREFNYTREDQDNYALCSYNKSIAAHQKGAFDEEIIPLTVKKKGNEEEVISKDEEPSRLNMEKFRKLTPDMGKEGTITVGNSSNLNDGAAAIILASGNYVLKKNLQPLARVASFAEGALEPRKFCIAPSVAIPKALVRANLTTDNIALWEISETFAVTAMANTKLLKLNPDIVNIHGGAISLGHPFGMTGIRLIVHLIYALEKGEYGCASLCHATGGASAMIIEKL